MCQGEVTCSRTKQQNYGKKGSFSWLFFVSHTRLGRGARDWGEALTTLVIHRTATLPDLHSLPRDISLFQPTHPSAFYSRVLRQLLAWQFFLYCSRLRSSFLIFFSPKRHLGQIDLFRLFHPGSQHSTVLEVCRDFI